MSKMLILFLIQFLKENKSYNIYENDGAVGIKGEDLNMRDVLSEAQYTGKNVPIIIADRGLRDDHSNYIKNRDKTLDIHAILTDNTEYQLSEDDIENRTQGTAFSSIAIKAAPKARLGFFHVPFDRYLNLQVFIKAYQKVKTEILAITGDHQSFIIKSGDIRYPYVNLYHWENSTDMVMRYNPKTAVFITAGNNGDVPIDSLYHSLASSHQTALVGASTSRGSAAYYSQRSHALLCNAPSGGGDSWYLHEYRDQPMIYAASPETTDSYNYVNGTGVAAAAVAGIAALIKEKNPNADMREIMYRIALTAVKNDPKHPEWICNKAGYWFNPMYGFGRVDGKAAIDLNITIKPNTTSYHYRPVNDDDVHDIEFGGRRSTKFKILADDANGTFIEFVKLTFCTRKIVFTDMRISLKSPMGTYVDLISGGTGDGFTDYPKYPKQPLQEYVFSSRVFFGEDPHGTWEFEIKHQGFHPLDEIWAVQLTIYGAEGKYTTDQKIQTREGADPYNFTTITDIKIETDHIICANNFSFSFNESLFDVPIMPAYLQEDNGRIYDLGYIELNGSYRYSIQIPCLLYPNKTLTFGVRDQFSGKAATTNVTIDNQRKGFMITHYRYQYEVGLNDTKPYDGYYNYGGNSTIVFSYARHDNHLPEHGFNAHIQVMIFDQMTRKLIYSKAHKDDGLVTIPMDVVGADLPDGKIAKGIMSISMMGGDECSTIIHPFRLYPVGEKIPSFVYKVAIDKENCIYSKELQITNPETISELETQKDDMLILGYLLPFAINIFVGLLSLMYYCMWTRKNADPTAGELSLSFVH